MPIRCLEQLLNLNMLRQLCCGLRFRCMVHAAEPLVSLSTPQPLSLAWDVGLHIAEALVSGRPPCSQRRQPHAQVEVVPQRVCIPRRVGALPPREHRVQYIVHLLPQLELQAGMSRHLRCDWSGD